ncbi:cell adhesion molecule Dscam1-like [Tubulanus polymorphus]|uniref:cell adhesion molecule Dscam1-like n=1 Tax=Tubulanus polymorphus TaxID=672921 RepID=UPI003DA37ACC
MVCRIIEKDATVQLNQHMWNCIQMRGQSGGDDTPQGPIFISEPPPKIAFANSKGALIPCSAYGRPAPIMDWVKEDGRPVEDIAKILRILPNNTLYFLPFRDADLRSNVHTASYRCVAKNSVGSIISRRVNVKGVLIRQYIAYKLRVNDVYITRGNTAVFKCIINPYFVREYISVTAWTQGSSRITPGDRFSIMNSGELHVRNVRMEDGYLNYRCITKNVLTQDEKSSDPASLYFINDPVNSAPVIEDALTHLEIRESDTVELPCAATGFPLPSFTWNKDGISVTLVNTRVRQLSGNLIIKNAGIGDSGRYVCIATNRLGQKTAITQLTVTAPLSVHVEPSHQIVDVGNTASFNCTIYGHPVKSIKWYKNGKILKIQGRITLKSPRNLVIKDVQRQDRGMYQCLVKNGRDNAQGTSQLALGVAKPAMHFTFNDDYVQPGSKVSLRCTTSGNPVPSVSWTLDDSPIPSISRYTVGHWVSQDGDVHSYVNITKVQIQDGGQYRCTAINKVGSANHSSRLFVYGVPYIRPMANVTAVANEKLVVRCHVAGFPITSITWSKGGIQLPINHRQQVSEDGTLSILNIQRSYDEGEYVCTAKNAANAGQSRGVTVKVMEPPHIDPFRFPQRKQGERVRVACFVSSGDSPITMSWVKDGKPIPPDLGVVLHQLDTFSSTLSIGDSTPRHNGNYTCIASNLAAKVNYTARFHVDVPPRWVVEPDDSYVVLDKSVTLDCQTTGTPEPKIIWKKAKGDEPSNYKVIGQDLDDSRVTVLPNGSLVISSARERDHGYYLCHASNNIGAGLSKVVFLTVHIPARFDETEKNYTVMKGHNITIDCYAIGDRPISVGWSFNGENLPWQYNRRLTVTTLYTKQGKSSHLKISPAVRDDTGFYVCTTQNAFGHDSLMIRLVVLERPEAPTNVNVEQTTSRSVEVSWRPAFDGNAVITQYIVQYKNSSGTWNDPMHNITVNGRHTRASIIGLHPSYTFHIRIFANNSVGMGEASRVLTATTTEEAPTGPPLRVRVEALGSQSLKVYFEPPTVNKRNGIIKGYYIGYKVFNSTRPFMYITKPVDQDFIPEQVINNLEKFTKYEVHVQAFNTKGAGPRSREVGVLTLEDVPSQPPQRVHATALSSTSIMVMWSPPPLYTLHGVLQGYKVLYKIVREDEDESDAQFVVSKELKVILQGLEKFTNYSLQVLAYTRMGEGVRCRPLYIRTLQDIPGTPSDIKALPMGVDSIMVSWKPPLHQNGILTNYILYMTHYEGHKPILRKIDVEPARISYLAAELKKNYEYIFAVSARTIRGEGPKTRRVKQTPVKNVAARISSFSSIVMSPWRETVTLPCQAVGEPLPKIKWKVRGKMIRNGKRFHVFPNGTLEIRQIESSDAANYTCRAFNVHGADEITVSLVVQAPPKQPFVTVAATTTSSIQINWRSGSNGGSAIRGFIFYYKKAFQDWQNVKLKAQVRSYTVTDLYCGTTYKFRVQAFNRVGPGDMSKDVTAKTNGSTAISPAQDNLIRDINSTMVTLALNTWLDGGCPITGYSIRYRVWGDDTWRTVSNHIEPDVNHFVVRDLHPATWYIMKVTAYNDAGLTEAELQFATLTYTGSTIKPIFIVHKQEQQFYEKIYIMVPLCATLVFVLVLAVAVVLFCRRRQMRMIYKNSMGPNLRRDLTAETSLMNDLDKRLNFESDTSRETPYTPEPIITHRNMNLLTDHSDDTGPDDTRMWAFQQNSHTNSDNSFENSVSGDSDGNINPYATFQYPREPAVVTKKAIRPSLHHTEEDVDDEDDEEEDDIDIVAKEKEMAQREAGLKVEDKKVDHGTTPPTKERQPVLRYQNVPGCDNEGLILSPRKYASADQIHSLFTTGGSRPKTPSAPYVKPKSTSSSSEKGSHRHSAISSITTVSSNHDELMLAYENAKKNPPNPLEYEVERAKCSPQPTDSSESTEPGIRLFTQSPPKPDEKRQAACEVPIYDRRRSRPSRMGFSSDTTEPEGPVQHKEQSPAHRRPRTKHKGKHRGQVVGKKVVRPSRGGPPRCHSRASTTSTNSEEVTYAFNGQTDSPTPPSPPDGYHSYDPYTEPRYGRGRRRSLGMNRGRHGTPLPRYDITPETPGTDECRPLVSATVRPALTSPREEDEVIGLLERQYRTVKEEGAMKSTDTLELDDGKNYTDNFTVV